MSSSSETSVASLTFVHHLEEFYRKHDRSWDDRYQTNAREVASALKSLYETSRSFCRFKRHVRNMIRWKPPAPHSAPDDLFSGPSRLFALLQERCSFVLEDSGISPNHDFLLFVAEDEAFPFSQVSTDLVHNVYTQECCNGQVASLAYRLRHILGSIGLKCKILEEQIVSSGLSGHDAFGLISSCAFKTVLRIHLNELEDVVGAYVEMVNRMYVFPLLKYGKYSEYLGRKNDLIANQFNTVMSMVECFLSLGLKEHENGLCIDPSFGASLSKLSIDMLIGRAGCDLDHRRLLSPDRGYIPKILLWIKSVSRCVGRSTYVMDSLWKRLHGLPEKVSHTNPFAIESRSELLRLLVDVENLKADVDDIKASMCAAEVKLKLEELDELAVVLSRLLGARSDTDVCASPSVESVRSALDCISEVVEELVQIPKTLTPVRVEDLQATLKHQSTRLDHVRNSNPLVPEEDLRRSIDLLDGQLRGLEQAAAEVGTDVLAIVFAGSVLAMYLVICILRKIRGK